MGFAREVWLEDGSVKNRQKFSADDVKLTEDNRFDAGVIESMCIGAS
jgi:hypothetical protein